jgi:hypothetical protein
MDKSELFSFFHFEFKSICLAIGFWLFCNVGTCQQLPAQSKTQASTYNFKSGEKLIYTMHYGWFEIGEAIVTLDDTYWYFEGKPYFYIQCAVTTSGFFGFFAKLDVCMESWVDARTLQPLKSNRNVYFGNKMDVRTDHFKYSDSVRINTYIEDEDKYRNRVFAKSDTVLLDALSSFLFLRSKPLNELYSDVSVQTFFSNHLYPFSMKYKGLVGTEWKKKTINVKQYDLFFPESNAFPKDKKAYVYVLNSKENLPIRMLVEMNYGDFTFELKKRESL